MSVCLSSGVHNVMIQIQGGTASHVNQSALLMNYEACRNFGMTIKMNKQVFMRRAMRSGTLQFFQL